ncbi:DUF6629 family protein [Streptomyces sp. ISL-100]|nr:DUF6629 family protein [Streptomyces sp. ISL-100]MBT2396724.1 hypothetical protein [Streptomyces sp. ISL-100]
MAAHDVGGGVLPLPALWAPVGVLCAAPPRTQRRLLLGWVRRRAARIPAA